MNDPTNKGNNDSPPPPNLTMTAPSAQPTQIIPKELLQPKMIQKDQLDIDKSRQLPRERLSRIRTGFTQANRESAKISDQQERVEPARIKIRQKSKKDKITE